MKHYRSVTSLSTSERKTVFVLKMPCYIMCSFSFHSAFNMWLLSVSPFFNCLREEEREDLDTSAESKETERKEQDVDTVTEDEEELGPNKKGRRGNTIKLMCVCMNACT